MKTTAKGKIIGLLLVFSLFCLTPAHAQEALVTGAAAGSGGAGAAVDLNFRIEIPSFIYFRVGTADAVVNEVLFSPNVAQMRAGTPIGPVNIPVELISNSGNIVISSLTGGPLTSGANTISFATIATASAGGDINPPTLADGVAGAPGGATAVGDLINFTDTWAYTYTPAASPLAAGSYTETATYTAAIP